MKQIRMEYRKTIKGLLFVIFTQATIFQLAGQAGSLDQSFGDHGIFSLDINNQIERIYSLGLLADGSIIAGGNTEDQYGEHPILIHVSSNGQLDESFGILDLINDTATQGSVQKVIVDEEGRIVVGSDHYFNGMASMLITRLQANGEVDRNFGFDGSMIVPDSSKTWSVKDIQLDGDQRIYVAGIVNNKGYVLRLLTDGNLDTTYASGGVYYFSSIGPSFTYPNAIFLNADGKVTSCGTFYNDANRWRIFSFRLTPEGVLDSTFALNGIHILNLDVDSEAGEAVIVDDSGRTLLAGSMYNGSKNVPLIQRLDPDGQPDESFGDAGLVLVTTPNNDILEALSIQPDQKIIAGGNQTIFRLEENGTIDSTFAQNGLVNTDRMYIFSMIVDASNNILAGGGKFINSFDIMIHRYHTTATTKQSVITKPISQIRISPNPVQNIATLEFNSDRSQIISIELLDIQGHLIRHLVPGKSIPAGYNKLELMLPSNLTAGPYLLSLKNAHGQSTQKMIKF